MYVNFNYQYRLKGSTAQIIHDQKDFIRELKKNWNTFAESAKNKPVEEAATA